MLVIVVLGSVETSTQNRGAVVVNSLTIDYKVVTYQQEALFRSQSDTITVGWRDPYFSLAAYWAPTIYQYVKSDSTYGYTQDYITRFDYDGDWIGNNNWDNFPSYTNNLYGYVYYAVIESETHYFIFYMFYHPRDWGKLFGLVSDTHENDMEGIMVAIAKDGSQYGSLLVMLTRAHMDFYQYSADPNVGDGVDNVDGDIDLDGHRPIVYVEAQGHGVYGVPDKVDDYYSNDGYIIYRYNANVTQHPDYVSDRNNISYALIPIIKAFWPKALDPTYIGDGKTFDKTFLYSNSRYSRSLTVPQSFDGDDGSTDAANPPWGMHDGDYDSAGLKLGDFFFDPANYTYTVFSIPYNFSLNYVYNPYLLETNSPESNYPDVQILSPSSGAYINSTQINISWIVNDESSLYRISVILDNGTTLYEGTKKGENWVLVDIPEGTHQINVTAIDVWGNYRSVVRKFYVDVTPPILQLISPENNSELNYTSKLNVSWAGNDSFSGIDHYEVKLDNGSWINVFLNESYEIINASLYNHTFYVRAVDRAGNFVASKLRFSLKPIAVSVGISNSSEIIASRGSLRIDVGEGDYERIEAYLNDTQVQLFGDSIIIDNFNDGHYVLRIKIYYPSGDIDERFWDITIDNTPPRIENITRYYQKGVINITWDYWDLVGIEHFEVFFGGSWHYLGSTTWYAVDTNSLDGSYYMVVIRGYDLLGNYRSVVHVFTVDKSPPTIDVSLVNNSYWAAPSVDMGIIAYDVSGVDKIIVYMNDSLVGVYSSSTTVSISFPTIGRYILSIIANDTNGNTNLVRYRIVVDWEKPIVHIQEPVDLEFISGSFNVSWLCSENAEYYIKIDNDEWIFLGSQEYYTINSLTSGLHTIYVLAIDNANNMGLSSVTIIYAYEPLKNGDTSHKTTFKSEHPNLKLRIHTNDRQLEANIKQSSFKIYLVNSKQMLGSIIRISLGMLGHAKRCFLGLALISTYFMVEVNLYPILGMIFFWRSANSRRTSISS